MKPITVAKNDDEISVVMDNLSDKVKVSRILKLYQLDEILEIIGYSDQSLEEEKCIEIDLLIKKHPFHKYEKIIAEKYAIDNGNFCTAIAYNKFLPL